jgi:hypothetical protein
MVKICKLEWGSVDRGVNSSASRGMDVILALNLFEDDGSKISRKNIARFMK